MGNVFHAIDSEGSPTSDMVHLTGCTETTMINNTYEAENGEPGGARGPMLYTEDGGTVGTLVIQQNAIRIPNVTTLPTALKGMLVFDASTGVNRLKYYNGSGWVAL